MTARRDDEWGWVTDPARLADGTHVEVAPMHATDGARLVRFHQRLSAETTRLRYFTFHPELTDAELVRFTHVDHLQREALIAVVEGEIVGVARFDRLAPGSDEAEAAFVVADTWQGRGVGSLLLRRLAARARRLGLCRLRAETLPENHRMLNVFRHSGLPMAASFDHGVITVVLELDPVAPRTSTSTSTPTSTPVPGA